VAAKLDERITGLEVQLKQLRTRQQRIEARKRALLSRRERAADTRRKILVGAIVLAKVEQGELDATQLRAWLDAALTRDDDRRLFGFEVLEQKGAHTEG
jgi:hypothetical protein